MFLNIFGITCGWGGAWAVWDGSKFVLLFFSVASQTSTCLIPYWTSSAFRCDDKTEMKNCKISTACTHTAHDYGNEPECVWCDGGWCWVLMKRFLCEKRAEETDWGSVTKEVATGRWSSSSCLFPLFFSRCFCRTALRLWIIDFSLIRNAAWKKEKQRHEQPFFFAAFSRFLPRIAHPPLRSFAFPSRVLVIAAARKKREQKRRVEENLRRSGVGQKWNGETSSHMCVYISCYS